MNDGAEELNGLRHALGKRADRLPRPVAEVVFGEQGVGATTTLREREAAERAHEGDRVARMHGRIEAAFLGEVSDLGSRLERALAAEHQPRPAGRVDDAEKHSEGGRLACAVGTEEAEDRAGGNAKADAIHRARLAEILDEVDRFDRVHSGGGLSKH